MIFLNILQHQSDMISPWSYHNLIMTSQWSCHDLFGILKDICKILQNLTRHDLTTILHSAIILHRFWKILKEPAMIVHDLSRFRIIFPRSCTNQAWSHYDLTMFSWSYHDISMVYQSSWFQTEWLKFSLQRYIEHTDLYFYQEQFFYLLLSLKKWIKVITYIAAG